VTADDAVLRSLAEAIGERYRRIREDERAFVEGLSEDEIRQRLEKLVVTIRRAKKPASESKSGGAVEDVGADYRGDSIIT